MRSRVFITQQPKPNDQGWTPNLSPATRFGALHFVFSGSDHPSADPDGAIFQAAEALADFRPESDYLLWPNGVDPFSVWACLIVLTRMEIPVLRGLSWNRGMTEQGRDKRMGYYTPVTFRVDATKPIPILTQPSKEQKWPKANSNSNSNLNRNQQHSPSHKQPASTSQPAKQQHNQHRTRYVQ
jgi:hypothetical protein